VGRAAQVSVSKIATNAESGVDVYSDVNCQIRVSADGYFSVLFLLSFTAGLLAFMELDLASLILLTLSWSTIPFLAFFDRINFDGERLSRSAIGLTVWRAFGGKIPYLQTDDIEIVETQAIRTARSDGKVYYRYRTEIHGKNLIYVFSSGNKNYRQMACALFPLIDETKLDTRTIELRDYLVEPEEIALKLEQLRLPSAEVLESEFDSIQLQARKLRRRTNPVTNSENTHLQAESLRQAANQLRVAGSLRQSLEAFRRALRLKPNDNWILYEFARGLNSYASSGRETKFLRRSFAALRLAERRAQNDAELLSRIGESYIQYGDLKLASRAFQRASELDVNCFRAIKGLAEVALREGKLAHVIHHFNTAVNIAEDKAIKRWTKQEAAYFSNLNENEDYMDAEISRVNWLESVGKARQSTMRLILFGLVIIAFGLLFDDSIAIVGWAVASGSMLAWFSSLLAERFLSNRCHLPAE
jgi:tetratricopeptide (TPR) repeat protein